MSRTSTMEKVEKIEKMNLCRTYSCAIHYEVRLHCLTTNIMFFFLGKCRDLDRLDVINKKKQMA